MFLAILKDIKKFIIDLLFPITCIVCEDEGEFICVPCKQKLKKLEHQHCIICQKPAIFGLTHANCKNKYTADALISVYDYHDENVSKIIIAGKYKFIFSVFEIFGKIIAKQIQSTHYALLTTHYVLVPIPLHSSRKRWRGFNQSEILCQTIAKYLNLSTANVLRRTKITKTQKNLDKESRQKNMKDAFGINISYPILNILNRNIILVDDVTTTGTTLNQAVKILKQNGASKVICLTVARD